MVACGQGRAAQQKMQWCWTVMGDSSFLSLPSLGRAFWRREVKQAEEDQEEREGGRESQSKGKKRPLALLSGNENKRLLGRAKIKATGRLKRSGWLRRWRPAGEALAWSGVSWVMRNTWLERDVQPLSHGAGLQLASCPAGCEGGNRNWGSKPL